MENRPLRNALILALGIVMALGTAPSWAQAGSMAIEMALASDTGTPGHGGCDGCPGDGGASGTCHSVCAPAVAMAVPSAPLMTNPGAQLPAPAAAVTGSGWSSPPDPSPPRTKAAG